MTTIPTPAPNHGSSYSPPALRKTENFCFPNLFENHRSWIHRWVRSPLLLFAIALLLPIAGWSQVDQGAITGTVSDSTGAIVLGANVRLTATETGLTLQAKSNQSGNYTFSPIKIGDYSVSVTFAPARTAPVLSLTVPVMAP